MKYIIAILILFTSCKTTKKTHELEKFKSEVILKMDSLSIKLNEFKQFKQFEIKLDTTSTDFQIEFNQNETGQIELKTPWGTYIAKKEGNGKVTLTGKTKSLKQNENKQTFEKTIQQTQETKNQNIKRQSEKESDILETKTEEIPWYLKLPWWIYILLILGILIWIFWKSIKIYLKNLPVVGRFIK